jgi:hypothetical protein
VLLHELCAVGPEERDENLGEQHNLRESIRMPKSPKGSNRSIGCSVTDTAV